MYSDINSLTPEEIKSFSDFVNSPFFNKSEGMKKLCACLIKDHPNVKEDNYSKQEITSQALDGWISNNARMRKVESEFNKLFEEFLIHNEIKKRKVESNILLMSILRKKFLLKTYKKKLDEIEKYPESIFGEAENYYLNKLNYFHELKLYSHVGSIESHSDKEMFWLNLYFVYQGLSFNANNHDEKSIPLGSMMKNIYEYIEKNKKYLSKSRPDIFVMYYVNLILEPDGIKYFEEFEKYYKKYENHFDTDLKTACHQFVLNTMYTQSSINPTTQNLTMTFGFFKSLLKDGYFKNYFEKGSIMAKAQYFSCFNILINFQAFDLAEQFAFEYSKYLPEQFRDKMMNIAKLILSFYRKDFTDVLKRLNEVKENTKLDVYTRFIKLMVLFELNDHQTLNYDLQSFSKHLLRLSKSKTLAPKEITRANRFVNLITLLNGAREGRESLRSKKLTELKSRLNSEEYMNEHKFWFLEKVGEINSKF